MAEIGGNGLGAQGLPPDLTGVQPGDGGGRFQAEMGVAGDHHIGIGPFDGGAEGPAAAPTVANAPAGVPGLVSGALTALSLPIDRVTAFLSRAAGLSAASFTVATPAGTTPTSLAAGDVSVSSPLPPVMSPSEMARADLPPRVASGDTPAAIDVSAPRIGIGPAPGTTAGPGPATGTGPLAGGDHGPFEAPGGSLLDVRVSSGGVDVGLPGVSVGVSAGGAEPGPLPEGGVQRLLVMGAPQIAVSVGQGPAVPIASGVVAPVVDALMPQGGLAQEGLGPVSMTQAGSTAPQVLFQAPGLADGRIGIAAEAEDALPAPFTSGAATAPGSAPDAAPGEVWAAQGNVAAEPAANAMPVAPGVAEPAFSRLVAPPDEQAAFTRPANAALQAAGAGLASAPAFGSASASAAASRFMPAAGLMPSAPSVGAQAASLAALSQPRFAVPQPAFASQAAASPLPLMAAAAPPAGAPALAPMPFAAMPWAGAQGTGASAAPLRQVGLGLAPALVTDQAIAPPLGGPGLPMGLGGIGFRRQGPRPGAASFTRDRRPPWPDLSAGELDIGSDPVPIVAFTDHAPLPLDLSPYEPACRCWRLDDTAALVIAGQDSGADARRAVALHGALTAGADALALIGPGEGFGTWLGSPLWQRLAGIARPAEAGILPVESRPGWVEALRTADGGWRIVHSTAGLASRVTSHPPHADRDSLLTDLLYGVARWADVTAGAPILAASRGCAAGDWRAREAWAAVLRAQVRVSRRLTEGLPTDLAGQAEADAVTSIVAGRRPGGSAGRGSREDLLAASRRRDLAAFAACLDGAGQQVLDRLGEGDAAAIDGLDGLAMAWRLGRLDSAGAPLALGGGARRMLADAVPGR